MTAKATLRSITSRGRHGVAHHDGGQVDVAGHVGDRAVALHAVELVAGGVDGDGLGPVGLGPGAQLAPHGGVGPALGVGRPDHHDAVGPEEAVEVEIPQSPGRPAGHVERGV